MAYIIILLLLLLLNTQPGQFYLSLFIQRLNHGHLLLCVMYCCLYLLALCAVPNNVCTMLSAATMLCCYHVTVVCCYHAVKLRVAALLCCHLRPLFMSCCIVYRPKFEFF
jgi:hypothetical protein